MLDQPVDIPGELPVVPLRNSVLFPGSVVPIDVARPRSLAAVEHAVSRPESVIALVSQRAPGVEAPGLADLHALGCASRILKVIRMPQGGFSVILQGLARVRLVEFVGLDPFMTARVETVTDPTAADAVVGKLVRDLKDMAKRVIALMPELPREATDLVDSIDEPGRLADLVASHLDTSVAHKQQVLETFDVPARLRLVLDGLRRTHQTLDGRSTEERTEEAPTEED